MKPGMPRVLVSCLAAVAAVAMIAWAPAAQAAPVPAKVELANLRAIQVNNLEKGDDNVFLVVQGFAKGADVHKRVPDSGTLKANPKKPAVTDKEPVTLWQGELDNGEYALLTVAVFQGEEKDPAKVKAFLDQVGEAGKAAKSKKTITTADAKEVAAVACAQPADDGAVHGQRRVRDRIAEQAGGAQARMAGR